MTSPRYGGGKDLFIDERESIVRDRDIWESPEWTWPDLARPCEERGRGEGLLASDQEEQS